MNQAINPTINTLFGLKSGFVGTKDFSWRLLRRQGLPWLLIPSDARLMTPSLDLYPPQNLWEKLCHAGILQLLKTPAVHLFDLVNVSTDPSSDWMQFLSRQSGQPAHSLPTPAIRFVGRSGKSIQLELLLFNHKWQPVRVVNAGLYQYGRATSAQAVDLISKLPLNSLAGTGLTGQFSNHSVSAYAMTYVSRKASPAKQILKIQFTNGQ